MSKWLVRGLVFAALMVIVRLVQGALINSWETKALLISVVLLVIYAITVFVWGLFDGRADARDEPDPDRRSDLAMTWLIAGLVAGVLSGLVAWIISLFDKSLYVEGLVNEVTTFAAFTALLVFLPGIAAVALGRWSVDRNRPDEPRRRVHGEGRADTDVFEAVRDEDEQTGPVATASTPEGAAAAESEEQTSSVTTAERTEERP
jgi:MFS family permease